MTIINFTKEIYERILDNILILFREVIAHEKDTEIFEVRIKRLEEQELALLTICCQQWDAINELREENKSLRSYLVI